MIHIECYILLFFVYSFLGWLMEVTQGIIWNKKFVNRGFLIGPYCPIYGYGVILITLCLSHLTDYPMALFALCIVICAILEYITSYCMEKLFNARWWDYSDKKFNINGRICLETMLAFGILGTLIIYIFNPYLMNLIFGMNTNLLFGICITLLIIYLVDNILSFRIVKNISLTTDLIKDNTEEITEKTKEFLMNKSLWTRRLVKAFPKMKIKLKKQIKKIIREK